MYVEIGTEAPQFPEKEYMNEIFVAVHTSHENTRIRSVFFKEAEIIKPILRIHVKK
jgi:hypothetical protein